MLTEKLFTLTESQKNKLIQTERKSFQNYCEEYGLDAQSREKELYNQFMKKIKQDINKLIEYHGVSPEQAMDHFGEFLKCKNYWELINRINKNGKKMALYEIRKVINELPLNYSYLIKISAIMNLQNPKKEDPSSVINLLKNVPIMTIWERDFNAFVVGRTSIANIPFIGYYASIKNTLYYFIDLFLSALYSDEPSKKVKYFPDDESLLKKATENDFLLACMGGNIGLKGEIDTAPVIPSCKFSHLNPR